MKEPTIEEHIAKARELTPQQTRVTEPAFEELIRAVEKMDVLLKYTHHLAENPPLIPPVIGGAVTDEEE